MKRIQEYSEEKSHYNKTFPSIHIKTFCNIEYCKLNCESIKLFWMSMSGLCYIYYSQWRKIFSED